MCMLRIVILIVLIVSILASPISYQIISQQRYLNVWPTYKYSFKHVGYVNIRDIVGNYTYRFYAFDLLWKTHSELCIASSPAIGDINNDGYKEVVYSSCDGDLYVVNGSNGEVLWKYSTGGMFADPTMYDIDGDGYYEILTVGASGNLYCLNYNGSEEWVVNDRMFSGAPAVGDVNGDGDVEVVMGDNDGYVYVINNNGTVETRVHVGDMPVTTPSLSDIDGDGIDEIVVVEGTYLHVIDYSIDEKKYVVYGLDLGSYLVPPPVLYDVNGDGSDDAVIVSKDAHVFIVDLLNGEIIAETKLNATDTFASPSIGNVDNDPEPEIVVGTMDGLYILNMSLSIKRYFPDLQTYQSSPIIADIDGDGENEIIFGLHTGEFVIVNATKPSGFFREVEWLYSTDAPIMASPAISDVDNDGLPEILVGSRDYNMYCFKGLLAENKATTTTSTTTTTTNTSTSLFQTTTSSSTTTTVKTTITSHTSTTTTTQATTIMNTVKQPIESTTTKKIGLPTATGHYKPLINWGLVIPALIVAVIIVLIVYYKTK